MKYVVCKIIVVVATKTGVIQKQAYVGGGLIREVSGVSMLVDFTTDATQKGYIGNYSKVLVLKKDCM